MFAVHAPQTVTLTTPGEDKPDATLNFKVQQGDSSRCVLQVIYPDGEVHELIFSTRGSLVDSHYTAPAQEKDLTEEQRRAEPGVTDHIVDGRDTRAFNPYTYEAPVTDDQKSREGMTPGFTQPPVASDEVRDIETTQKQEAAERAVKALEDLRGKSQETAEQRAEREKQEEDQRFEDRISSQQAAADAPTEGGPVATAETFPSHKTQDLVAGKNMDGSPINESTVDNDPNSKSYNPMAPAPSSPQPGSPPPHPLDQPDPGKVTTSKDFSGEPGGTFDEQDRLAMEEKRAQLDSDTAEINRRSAAPRTIPN